MDKQTINIIRVCKGHLQPKIETNDYEDNLRLWMTEYTGSNWFKYPYLPSMYCLLEGAFRDFHKSFGFDTTLLFHMFDSYKSKIELSFFKDAEIYKTTAKTLYLTMIESICSALALIPVRNFLGRYINSFKEEDFAEELCLSKETLKLYEEYLNKQKK